MVKVDLITGFLGSGKTTFLKKMARYLCDKGENLGILENDFGAVNVDMMLLQDLEGEHCELEMVAGGCDYDCHKRRFKTKLIAMGMCGYDRVLIEPSGIYDTDEFFDVLCEEPLDQWYQIGNVWMIMDGDLEESLSEQSKYLLVSQLAVAGKVIISRGSNMPKEKLLALIERLNHILQEFNCSRILTESDVICKNWDTFTESDAELLLSSGHRNFPYHKLWFEAEEAFSSLYYMDQKISEDCLKEITKRLFSDGSYGKVFRVKGFVRDKDGKWKEINAAKDTLHITDIREGQDVQIVIGENLKEEAITQLFKGI